MCFIVRGFALIKLNVDQWSSTAELQGNESSFKVTGVRMQFSSGYKILKLFESFSCTTSWLKTVAVIFRVNWGCRTCLFSTLESFALNYVVTRNSCEDETSGLLMIIVVAVSGL